MATNEILQFAETDTGTNLLTQAEYLSDAQRPIGNQPGVARSKLVNKALRQASLIAAGLAEYIADNQANNVTDALTPQNIADYLQAAITGALGVTPPQFDNDTSLATTQFVQRALGNMSAAKIVNATGNILAADAGKFIEVLGTSGNITLTLPDISTVPSGTTFEFYNNAGFGCTIQRSGSATIADGSGTAKTDYTLRIQSTARFISDGFNWFLTSGTGGHLLAASGYQRLPSGLIIQWGTGTTPAGGLAGTFTFPISFPTAALSIAESVISGSSNNFDGIEIVSFTASQFQAGGVSAPSTGAAVSFRYIAIGY